MDAGKLKKSLIPVIYRDDTLIVVDKPPGVDISARRDAPLPGLIEILWPEDGPDPNPTPVNRLSRYESGILLLSLHDDLTRALRTLFRKGGAKCQFLALVSGTLESSGKRKSPARKAKRSRRPPASDTHGPVGPGPGAVLTTLATGRKHSCLRYASQSENTHALRAFLRGAGVRLVGDNLGTTRTRLDPAESTYLHLTRMTFVHPLDGRNMNFHSPAPESPVTVVANGVGPQRHVQAALIRRIPFLGRVRSNAYRLLTGDKEGARGLTVERFGPLLLCTARASHSWSGRHLTPVARWYCDMLGMRTAVARFPDTECGDSPKPGETRALVGRLDSEEIVIWENGAQFHIRPLLMASVGLFLDQRNNRRWVREQSAGRRVLNLFAHTCGFSVCAALGGARGVTSVDLSRPHLEWGKRNFAINGLAPDDYGFFVGDALGHLKRAQRDGTFYNVAIIDAPTFAHGKKRRASFAFARDLPTLLRATAPVLEPGGVVMVTSNSRRLARQQMQELVGRGLSQRPFRVIATPELPQDFASDPEHAKTIVVRVD